MAIVGNSAALGALTAEACVSWDLEVTHGPVSLSAEAVGGRVGGGRRRRRSPTSDVDSVLDLLHPARW